MTQRIAAHLQLRFGLDVLYADLRLEIAGGETMPLEYSMLDLVFVGATSSRRDLHFQDGLRVFLPALTFSRILPLPWDGERLL